MVAYQPQIVLITGATGDFGKAFARHFDAMGCHLILHGRSADKLDQVLKEMKSPAHGLCFDITDKHAMHSAMESLPPDFQDIDLLINNAGLALGLEPAYDCDLEDWDIMIDVNAKALSRMSHIVLKTMKKNLKGHIINIGSTAGNYPYPGGNVYCAVKAFVKQFSLALRADLSGTNIRVTNIEPGAVETQFSSVRFKGDEDKARAVYAGTQSLQAEDIAQAVAWVATLPPYCNVNRLEMMPTGQAFGPLTMERKS